MPTTTNYGWTTPADTDLVKDGAAAIRTLGSSIDTTVFNNASAAIPKTIVDAKGDLIAATAADTVSRLAVGTNGQLLAADSAAATGLAWVPAPASGGMTLTSTTSISGSGTTISSIPSTYKHLLVVGRDFFGSTSNMELRLRLNGDSGSNYAFAGWNCEPSTINPINGSAGNGFYIGRFSTTNTGVGRGVTNAWIYNYTNTGQIPVMSQGNGANIAYGTSGVYNASAAISSLFVYPSSGTISGGSVLLYGVS